MEMLHQLFFWYPIIGFVFGLIALTFLRLSAKRPETEETLRSIIDEEEGRKHLQVEEYNGRRVEYALTTRGDLFMKAASDLRWLDKYPALLFVSELITCTIAWPWILFPSLYKALKAGFKAVLKEKEVVDGK